jgi:diguanylate cyclase (GGDEF)-like protein
MVLSLFARRRKRAVSLAWLLVPSGILFTATLGFVFSMILHTSEGMNDLAADRQRFHIRAALEHQLEELSASLARLSTVVLAEQSKAEPSAPDIDRAIFERSAASRSRFDAIFLLDRSGAVQAGEEAGPQTKPLSAERLRRFLDQKPLPPGHAITLPADLPLTASQGHRSPNTRLIADEGELLAVTSHQLPARDGSIGNSTIMGIKRFDADHLGAFGELYRLSQFSFAAEQAAEDAVSIPIRDLEGDVAGHLVWSPERPGQDLRDRLLPLASTGLVAALFLFGFVVFYLHRVAKELARSQTKSQEMLGRDGLSGLANRTLFGDRLDQELRDLNQSGASLAVMFLDLDRFKDVNDTYGHQAGDELIRLVAQRVANLLRGTDLLARFGGDEFAIIQTNVHSVQDVEALARRILDSLTHPFALSGTFVSVGVSIGVALAPEHGDGRELLMRLADTALYQAKSEGRNRFVFFQSHMDETIRMRKVVEDDLRRAIEGDQLVIHYQPLVAADGEKIVGLEALVRWPHPTRGLINPTEFVAIAEERGLIIPLGEWVLRRACEDGKRWPDVRIAVNVSPIQFRHRSFVDAVTRTLAETGFEASRLELELTEGVVVEDADAAEEAMMDLRALGVHLALDDFGTGYSSLIYLRRFAFDKIKIDRSFLESMEATGESAILVHSIVHLGRALGLTVTAEGVETREQHRFLQALGCHQLQGFLFSKPLPRDEIDVLLGYVAPVALPDEETPAISAEAA